MSKSGIRKPTRGTMLRTPMAGMHILPGRVRHTGRRNAKRAISGPKR